MIDFKVSTKKINFISSNLHETFKEMKRAGKREEKFSVMREGLCWSVK